MRGATGVSLQLHQILPLPGQTNLYLPHKWNVIYNESQPPTSPNTALATQSYGSRLQWKVSKPSIASAKRNLIRPWSEHNPKIRSSSRSCRFRRPYSSHLGHAFYVEKETFRAPAISQNFTKCRACHEKSQSTTSFSKYCPCHEKRTAWLIRITYETSFTMRRATRVTLQLQQILPLPRKMNLMIDPHFKIKRHLQCAEQVKSPFNTL